jgi:hypothetical protein
MPALMRLRVHLVVRLASILSKKFRAPIQTGETGRELLIADSVSSSKNRRRRAGMKDESVTKPDGFESKFI